MDDSEIMRRFWGLADLLSPPRIPAWAPGPLALTQTLRQRAFKQRYKLDLSILFAEDAGVEVGLRLEPAPRIHGGPYPPSLAILAEALDRQGYVGRWDPEPGHAAANGTWVRAVRDLAAANEEVSFARGLPAALERDGGGRAKTSKPAPGTRGLTGWPLVRALRSNWPDGFAPLRAEFERPAGVDVGGRRCDVRIAITFLAGTMNKWARAHPCGSDDDAGRRAAEAAVAEVIGRTRGSWWPGAEATYSAFTSVRSLEVAARFVAATERL